MHTYTESILDDEYALRTDHPDRLTRGETEEYATMEQDASREASEADHVKGLENKEEVQERQRIKKNGNSSDFIESRSGE